MYTDSVFLCSNMRDTPVAINEKNKITVNSVKKYREQEEVRMNKDMLENIQNTILALCDEELVQRFLKKDKQYQEIARLLHDSEKSCECILKRLSEEDRDRLEQMLWLKDREGALYDFWVFAAGFYAGAYFGGICKSDF